MDSAHWFWLGIAALECGLRLVLAGLPWVVRWRPARELTRLELAWIRVALATVLSVSVVIVSTTLLGWLGWYTPWTGRLVSLGCFVGGLAVRRPGWGEFRICLPAVGWVLAGLLAVLAAPNPSRHLAGGQDAGIYASEGIRLARTGSFRQVLPEPLSQLEDGALASLCRYRYNFREFHPVTPVEPVSHEHPAVRSFFFPATPGMIALTHQAGGIPTALRAHAVIGFLAMVVAGGLLLACGAPGITLIFLPATFLLQPIWIYSLWLNFSENLQVLLISGLVLVWQTEPRRSRAGWDLALLACAVLNRFTFTPLGAILVWMETLQDVQANAPGRFRRWLLRHAVLIATACGIVLVYPDTVARLQDHLPMMLQLGLGCMTASGLMLAPRFRGRLLRLPVGVIPALLGSAFVVHMALLRGAGGWGRTRIAMDGLWHYAGPAAVAAILLAGLAWLLIRPKGHPGLTLWFGYMGAGTVLVLTHFDIAVQFPWAARRFLLHAVPLIAVGLALGLGVAARASSLRRASALLAVAILAWVQRPALLQAWRTADYAGMDQTLRQIAEAVPGDALIIADHFLWGTPLLQAWDLPVINGEVLWEADASDLLPWTPEQRMRRLLPELERLARTGTPVLFLTSTGKGVDVYPVPPRVELIHEFPPYLYQKVDHSVRARGFQTVPREKRFRIYRLIPTAGSGGSAPESS